MLYPPLRASAYSLSNSTLTKVSYCKGNIFFNILIAAINPTKVSPIIRNVRNDGFVNKMANAIITTNSI